jgi:hypothetical protein
MPLFEVVAFVQILQPKSWKYFLLSYVCYITSPFYSPGLYCPNITFRAVKTMLLLTVNRASRLRRRNQCMGVFFGWCVHRLMNAYVALGNIKITSCIKLMDSPMESSGKKWRYRRHIRSFFKLSQNRRRRISSTHFRLGGKSKAY